MSFNFFATCPKGMESLLFEEVSSLGMNDVHETVAGVSFKGSFEDGLKTCLWSRFASRILLELSSFECSTDTELYLGANGVAWENWFSKNETIAVDFRGTSEEIRNSQYGALKVKDAVCDRFQTVEKGRPSVDKDNPDVQIYCHLERRGVASIALDLSGRALLKREINRSTGVAPLKENLAAAMVKRSGYDRLNFIDPMCGSGTLLIEAALLATDTAPGLKRRHYGFFKLKPFDGNVWQRLTSEASERSKQGREAAKSQGVKIYGFDKDERIVEIARENAKRAGFEDLIEVQQGAVEELENPFLDRSSLHVTVVTNPPYGRRIGNFNELLSLYTDLGSALKTSFKGARAAVISSSSELLSCLRLHSDKVYRLYNGELECQLRVFDINETEELSHKEELKQKVAEDFQNRLKKNLAYMRKWAKNANTNAYRVYDADVPEYAAAIDYYNGYYVIQAYAAPSKVNPRVAKRHVLDMISATVEITGVPGDHVILKNREIKKGDEQYEKAEEQKNEFMTVNEDNALFRVNLHDYLDTGLFLDARIIRQRIRELAKGKDFLNLFAYTSSASVAAALGGAKSTLSVDMSRTYLEWSIENFKLNSLSLSDNRFEQADCLAWISKDHDRKFDLIYIDPPSFSNSKRMERSFDVRRDHLPMLSNLTRLLKDGGTVIFCTNRRGFKLDEEIRDYGFDVLDISMPTIPRDFARNSSIHSCFMLTYHESQKTKEPEVMTEGKLAQRWSGELKESSGDRFRERPERKDGSRPYGDSRRSDSFRRDRKDSESRPWRQNFSDRDSGYRGRRSSDSSRDGTGYQGRRDSYSQSGSTRSSRDYVVSSNRSSTTYRNSSSGTYISTRPGGHYGEDRQRSRGYSSDYGQRDRSFKHGLKRREEHRVQKVRVWGPDGVKDIEE